MQILDFPVFSCYTVFGILSVKNGRAMGESALFFVRKNMKQKVLSLFLSLALLCSAAPFSASAADETSPTDEASKSGIKLGLSDGDVVYFAGKDEPMAWRVLEPSAKAVFTEGNIFDFLVRLGDEPVDYFDCLAEGSVFTNTDKDYFRSSLQGKSVGLLFVPDPGILTEQPQDARV